MPFIVIIYSLIKINIYIDVYALRINSFLTSFLTHGEQKKGGKEVRKEVKM